MPDRSRRIAVLLNDAFADWEIGFLTASARDFFQTEVEYFSPRGGEVESEGGLRVRPVGGFRDLDVPEYAALVVCGSANWAAPKALDISALLHDALTSDTVVGVICAGTLTAARAGLFETRRHTSNGADWLKKNAPAYQGAALYQDVNAAVADDGVVSAPSSAPAAFASELLNLLYPGHEALAQTRTMLARAT
jgi:putative intracellular protease/amidase